MSGHLYVLDILDDWLGKHKEMFESKATEEPLSAAGGAYRAFWGTQTFVKALKGEDEFNNGIPRAACEKAA